MIGIVLETIGRSSQGIRLRRVKSGWGYAGSGNNQFLKDVPRAKSWHGPLKSATQNDSRSIRRERAWSGFRADEEDPTDEQVDESQEKLEWSDALNKWIPDSKGKKRVVKNLTAVNHIQESALEEEREEIAQDIGNRLNNIDWCPCAQCQAMSTAEESQCCHGIARTYDKISGFNEALQCITNYPVFPSVCRDQHVLETAYYYTDSSMINTWKTATRGGGISAVHLMVWVFLSKEVRVPLQQLSTKYDTFSHLIPMLDSNGLT